MTVTPPPPSKSHLHRLWLLRMSPEQDARWQCTKLVRTRWPSLFGVKGQCCLAIEISINVIPVVNVVMLCGEEVELYLVFTAKQSSWTKQEMSFFRKLTFSREVRMVKIPFHGMNLGSLNLRCGAWMFSMSPERITRTVIRTCWTLTRCR